MRLHDNQTKVHHGVWQRFVFAFCLRYETKPHGDTTMRFGFIPRAKSKNKHKHVGATSSQPSTSANLDFWYSKIHKIYPDVVSLFKWHRLEGLAHERCNSIANTLELRLSCINTWICSTKVIQNHWQTEKLWRKHTGDPLHSRALAHSRAHCSHSRAPIVHTAVPRENNEHGCVYLRCRAVCKLPGCVEGHPWNMTLYVLNGHSSYGWPCTVRCKA